MLDIFQDILQKPTLSKQDISLIIDRITVYNDHLDIRLKSDVDALIQAKEDSTGNFPLRQ